MSALLVFLTLLYLFELAWFRIGIQRASRIRLQEHYQPTVSVIVAARNEEKFIAACLDSIAASDYPADKLQIIAVNDHSRDGTEYEIRQAMLRHPNLKNVNTTAESGNLRGKTNAVAQGIAHSSGEILMFTDADCTVPASWIAETVRCFDDKTGIVGGFTLLKSTSAFEGMQALDWLFLFGISSAAIGWDMPITAIGNNLSVRRAAYDATGGYATIPFSVTEDYALVQAILTRTTYGIRFPVLAETAVTSNPCKSVSQLAHQKQRWGVGGLDMVLHGLMLTAVGWIYIVALIAGCFVGLAPMVAGLALIKFAGEYWFLSVIMKRLNAHGLRKYFWAFVLYFPLYVVPLPIVARLSKKIVWKERSL
jgi:cellulose synthase/poly-beta-1,6-N-acetylglucosamine synthase-like glycosyltransferase